MAAFVLLFSFLDVLAARKDPAGLSGEVLIDGAPQPPNFKCLSGYVVQVGTRIWSNRFKEALIPHLLALSPHQIFLPKDNLYDNFAHNNKGRGATRKKIWPAEMLIMKLKCSLGPRVSAMQAHGQGWQGWSRVRRHYINHTPVALKTTLATGTRWWDSGSIVVGHRNRSAPVLHTDAAC